MADPRPNIQKVKTKSGGDLYVDFNLLNPDQQKKALQYTPEVMSVAPPVMESAPEKLYETPQDAPGLMSVPVRPEELQSTVPAPTPSPDVVSATPYTADRGEPMWRGAPEPAAMVAPTGKESPRIEQRPQPQLQQPPLVVEDTPITGGIDYVRTGGGGVSQRTKDYQQAVTNEQQVEKEAKVAQLEGQSEGYGQISSIYSDAQKRIAEKQDLLDKQREAGQQAYQASIAKHDAALEELRNTKVTGGFANGGDAFIAILGMLMRADVSPIMSFMQKNIQMQNANIDRKKEYINGLKISGDMKKQMISDIDDQKTLASSQYLEGAKLKIEEVANRTKNVELKEKAKEVLANINQQIMTNKEVMAQKNAQAASQGVKERPWIATPFGKMHVTPAQYLQHEKDQRTGGLTAGEQMQREKFEYEKAKDAKAMSVTGYEGQAPSEADARRFRDALPTYQATIKAIDDMANIAEGTNFLERGAAKVPGLYSNLKTKSTQIRSFAGALYKGLPQVAFGALSEGDRAMVDDFLTDPMSFVQKGGNIKRAKEIVQNMVKTHAESIGLRSKTAPSSGVKAGL